MHIRSCVQQPTDIIQNVKQQTWLVCVTVWLLNAHYWPSQGWLCTHRKHSCSGMLLITPRQTNLLSCRRTKKKSCINSVCNEKELNTPCGTFIFGIHLIILFQNIDFTVLNNQVCISLSMHAKLKKKNKTKTPGLILITPSFIIIKGIQGLHKKGWLLVAIQY